MNDQNMTDEEKKKFKLLKKIWHLNIYKNEFLPFQKRMSDLHFDRIEFRRGILLGLILGIVGNLLVQYSYPFIEGIIVQRYNDMFFVSSLILILSLLAIFYSMNKFENLSKSDLKGMDAYDEGRMYYERMIEQLELEIEAEKMDYPQREK